MGNGSHRVKGDWSWDSGTEEDQSGSAYHFLFGPVLAEPLEVGWLRTWWAGGGRGSLGGSLDWEAEKAGKLDAVRSVSSQICVLGPPFPHLGNGLL